MIKEFEFLKIINNTLSKNTHLGDDCAYLKDFGLVISSDALVEDVHFSFDFMNSYEIGKKALLVNISDILSSGAKPKYATVTLSGKLNENFIKDFYKGINEIANYFNVEIIGGDLTSGDKITISITIFGETKGRNISSRSYAKPGYILAVAGIFGLSAKGLEELRQGIKQSEFIDYHKCPILQKEVSEQIGKTAKHPYAMMDSSDGLIDCIYQLSDKSKVEININYNSIPKKIDNKDFVLYGGEDYSLVGAFHKEDFIQLQKTCKNLVQIGSCSEGKGIYLDGKEIEYRGFNHFE